MGTIARREYELEARQVLKNLRDEVQDIPASKAGEKSQWRGKQTQTRQRVKKTIQQ